MTPLHRLIGKQTFHWAIFFTSSFSCPPFYLLCLILERLRGSGEHLRPVFSAENTLLHVLLYLFFLNHHPRICLLIWERERNINWLPPIYTLTRDQTHNPRMSWLGIELASFWCTGWCSNQLSHPARAALLFAYTIWYTKRFPKYFLFPQCVLKVYSSQVPHFSALFSQERLGAS